MRANVQITIAVAALWLAAGASPARAQAMSGQSPGPGSFGTFAFSGPTLNSGSSNFGWVINDAGPSSTFPNAPGVAGPYRDANNQVSGWDLSRAIIVRPPYPPGAPATPGDFYWDATPSDKLALRFTTLLGPRTTVGYGVPGPMADFDPNQPYSWAMVTFQGNYKTHNTAAYPNGPPTDSATLNASTILDLTGSPFGPFVNPHPGTFGWVFDGPAKELDLVYSPIPGVVPEPGTLGLVAVGLLGVWRASRRRGRAR
jgi:hypothetical protein